MTDSEQRQAAKRFADNWKGKGYEKGQSQAFWLSLLRDVFGVEHPENFIAFEEQVHLDHTSFIDGTIPATKVLIEQKGLGKDLNKPIRQSDGSLLNPFQQAKKYILELPVSRHPRWVVTCNFAEFYVYDMERPGGEPEVIQLKDLGKEYYRLQFLVDTGIFGSKSMFHDYLRDIPAKGIRKALVELFKILDQKPEDRDIYLADDNPELASFPYVNGGLFSDENIEIPPFTQDQDYYRYENP